MAKLTLQTGVKNYEIYDENDKLLGTISIYPNDFNFGARAIDVIPRITGYINSAEEIAQDNTEIAIERITDIDNKIKTEIDYLFNSSVSETVFKGLHCLDVVSGGSKFFIESFLDMIMPVIEKEMGKAAKASQQRVDAYTKQVIDE